LVAKKLGGQKKLGGLQALLKNGALNIIQHPRLLNYACLWILVAIMWHNLVWHKA